MLEWSIVGLILVLKSPAIMILVESHSQEKRLWKKDWILVSAINVGKFKYCVVNRCISTHNHTPNLLEPWSESRTLSGRGKLDSMFTMMLGA